MVSPPLAGAWVSQSQSLQRVHQELLWSPKWFLSPHCCAGGYADVCAFYVGASGKERGGGFIQKT